ncbi:methyltransferase family protein [Sinobacterium caligoides]|uniref:Methyltransferase family protein n=1 Tax=Sinobacterium caligoides TaxID=933926 RepID=A0A3N2E205_9GAMM|nr:class I SAM-dependent methyltransferase [Sinobacterium caligoides]ROS06136.1 methyltransferase family protein [Sinobacterium caligoides]
MQTSTPSICPLCQSDEHHLFYRDQLRSFLHCQRCSLVYVPSCYHLGAEQEKAEYDLHQNRPDDQGYRKFLNRLCAPLIERLTPKSHGLDFGCGPGPTLSLMLEELGHHVSLFDIYYCNTPEVLNKPYDFITATEVIEHLSKPAEVLDKLWQQIKPGGYLAIMTKLVINQQRFACWHYKNDRTHISFFSQATFNYFFSNKNAYIEYLGDDVIIINKS